MKRKIGLSCKCIFVLFSLFLASSRSLGQSITNYSFIGTTAGFTPISGGSTTTWTGSTDDGTSALIPIGFDFWYMGARYTGISASTNGWISMGSVPTDYVYTNSLSTAGSPRPVIAPLWDDLDIVVTNNVTYKTSGAVGSRVFSLQYVNVKWYYLATGAVCSFQVNLYETSGKVEFVYRSDAAAAASASGSIGITATATGSGNFLSVNSAGTAVSSTTETSITTKRVTGRTYTFTSPIPIAPSTLSFSAIGNTAMTLNWADLSSNERGFTIYRSTDGINYSFVNQVAAGATSSSQTGLNTGTTYYWKVYALSEGALSTALSGTQATSCNGPAISQLPSSLLSYYKFEGNPNDATGNNNGTFQGGTPTQTADRFNNANKAYTFNGSSQFISAANAYVNPSTVSVSVWFKTSTAVGGTLVGFSSVLTGGGGSRDRFIYMTSTGVLYFGVAPGSTKKYISTTTAYNDGNWHLATGTVGASGLKLYVDGSLVISDATVTSGESYTGYWRVGYSDLSTWPNEPASYYFSGTLDDVIIYHKELTAAEVAILYNSPDGAGSNSPVCSGASLNLTATTVASASYSWTGPNGFTSSLQNPVVSYSATAAGVYTVQVTAAGCITPAVAYVTVTSTTATGQWTGNVSTDWSTAANWCNGILPTSTTDVTITSTATRMPNISTSVSCRNLTINAGSTLTLAGTGTLNIAGILANNGTFTNTGTVNFNGTGGQQTFTGITSFFNLSLNNSNGLLLPAAITVNNNLLLTAGTLNANNFNLTIKGNWTNNVSTTAFTAGTATVIFNNTTAQVIAGTFSTTFNNLVIANTASTVTLNTNISISGNLSVNSGTFDLGTFTANRATAGGTLMVANNAILKIGGTNTYPVNFTANTLVVASTVEYSGTAQTVANQLYGNLTLSSSVGAAVKIFPATALTVVGNLSSNLGAGTSVSYTAASNITVNGNVSISASTTFNGGSFSHSIGSNWVNTGTFNGNTGTLTFTGSGSTVSGSGNQNFNNLTIAASLVSFLAGSISLTGNLATTGSGSFSQLSGGTILMTGTSKTISGTGISPDNLTISGTVSTADALVITGNLSVSGSFTTSAGAITMSGTSKTISGAGTMSFSTLSVTGTITSTANFTVSSSVSVNGSLSATAGTATFTGTSTLSGTANLFNTTINGTSLQLSASSTLGIANALTITSGILDVSASAPNTVNFNGSGAQNINAITYNNLTLSNGNNKTAIAALTINNSLTISTGTTFIPGAFTHSIYGNWNNSGTFTAGTSTIQFLGNQASNIIGVTTFNILTINNTTAATGATLQSNITAATVNMTMGTLLTEANTLTITSTRTGNGIILGNIQRNHVFTTGVAYAFEGPDNLVTFSGASGINSVTVSVVIGPLSDFPFGGSISRFYTITIASGSYTSATLRLHYEDTELNGSNEATMGLWRYNGTSWSASGKTANDATANYVEQSLLPNITNRWTLSDNSNVVQWNGSVSTAWNTAANWTTVQGSASTPPSATDIVNLGTMAFTNQPTISSTVSVKNINFGSAQAVTLSMAGGGSLTSGDIYGTWSSNVTHSINANNQSVTINGNLSLSDGTSGHAINLNIGTGTVTLSGSLTQSGGANVVFSGAGNLIISMNHNYVNGTFTSGTGTVTYSGVTNQVIGAVSYNNLTINKSAAAAEINDTLSIGGNLTVAAGELDNFSTTTITGNVVISSGAVLNNSGILHIGGNWANSGTYDDAGTKIIFDGSGTQTITASTFNNLEINKPVGTIAVLTGDVTLKGNLTGTSGTLDIKSFFFNRTVVGGTAIIADAGTLIIAADNAPNKFANYALSTASTVIFNGTGTQHLLLPGVVYGNLIFRDTGLKILYTPITVNGDLTIETGATFDGGSNTLTLNGNWINSGTFTPSTSTVLCSGASKNITGNTTFNKMTVTGSYTILNNVTFNNLLNITSTGSLSGGSTITTTVNGDLTNSGVLYTLGTSTFTGNVQQTLSLINAVTTVAITVNFNGTISPVLNSTSVPQFGFLNINNTGGVNASVGWTILYALTVGSGASFNGGNSTHNILGSATNNGTITSSGTLNFIPATATTINLGTAFSSTGTVVFGGAGAMTLAGSPTSFRNVVITNTNAAGITPSSVWTITNNFSINSGAILNAGSYSHLVAGNISNNGTLNGNTSTFTLNGAAVQNIYSLSPFNNLTVSNTAGSVLLLSNVGVNGILNFIAGYIQTGSNILIQSSTGNVTGAAQNTGWVNGQLQKSITTGATTKIFEIGDAASYTPVSLTFANVTTAGYLMASTTSGDHPEISSSTINAARSVNRFWTLTNSGVVLTSYNVTFNFVAADLDAGVTTGAFIVGGFSGFTGIASGSWNYPMVGTPTSSTIQATGVTEFGDFQIGEMSIFIKTWDGGAGTSNWGDAANWNVDGVPTAIDNVELTGAYTININIGAVTKNLLLSNTGLVLTTNAGNSLAISGDFTLNSGTFNTEAAFPSVSGTVDVTNGTVGFIGATAQTIPAYNYYNLISGSTGSRTFASSGTIGIANAFTPGTNTYIITGSTVNFNGTGSQIIPMFNYNQLTLSNAGLKTFNTGTTGIAGILAVTEGATTNTAANTSTISYNGPTDQTVTTIPYYNLDAANSGGIVTLLDAVINNNLSVTSGTVSIGTNTTVQKITVDGAITVSSGATLNVATISDATHLITISGDVTNNGILNLKPDVNSLGNTTFNKDGNQTISGSGISDFHEITVNQGSSNLNTLTVTTAGFVVPNGF
ncbi:beta strand repeat-containing protein, partial [Flavobacterium cerinum]